MIDRELVTRKMTLILEDLKRLEHEGVGPSFPALLFADSHCHHYLRRVEELSDLC